MRRVSLTIAIPEALGAWNIGQIIAGTPGAPGADIQAVFRMGCRHWISQRRRRDCRYGDRYSHPDLAGNVWSGPARLQRTIGGRTITCAAGTHGFKGHCQIHANPFERQQAGTHVAGTIGAVATTAVGVAASNCSPT